MKSKLALLMEETGCDRAEAELALELCGYDVQAAVQAIPRIFQNILVVKGRLHSRREPYYGLWLVILNLQDRSLLRARAVVSFNPAVYACDLGLHWFDFESRLYACRLLEGTLQDVSQEAERRFSAFFASSEAAPFFSEKARVQGRGLDPLKAVLAGRLGEPELEARAELLDMGQFQEVRPAMGDWAVENPAAGRDRTAARRTASSRGAGEEPLSLKVSLFEDSLGFEAASLRAGDWVYAVIDDGRDIARYLSKLLGAQAREGSAIPVPVEAVEPLEGGCLHVRVRFSSGLCGDAALPPRSRVRARRRVERAPWWKRIFSA
jgi:hypothetical protein